MTGVQTWLFRSVAGIIAWVVTTFSLAPLVTTFWPVITLKQCLYGFIACTIVGIVFMGLLLKFKSGRDEAAESGPDSNRRPAGMSRAAWRAELRERRVVWRTPKIETLKRPAMSMGRRIGLLTLRAYIVFAIIIMVIKLIQVTTAHH